MRRLLTRFHIRNNRDYDLLNPNPNPNPVNLHHQQQQQGNNGDGGYGFAEGRPSQTALSSVGRNDSCDGDVTRDTELRMASSCDKMTGDDSEYDDATSTDREIEAADQEAKRESSEDKDSEIKRCEEKQRMDAPPSDDCCPICFGNFVVPCRGPCGHWYCGGCLLQYWNYTAALQPCSCPMCSRKITQLTPEALLYQRREAEIVDVLRNVRKYNRLFVGGAYGLILKVFELPLYIKRMFSEMMNPDRPGAHLNKLRLIAMLLGVLYSFSPFDFLRLGRHNVVDIFDHSAILISLILYGFGIYMRRRRVHNVRELAAIQL